MTSIINALGKAAAFLGGARQRDLDNLLAQQIFGWEPTQDYVYPSSGAMISSYRARAWRRPKSRDLIAEEHIPQYSSGYDCWLVVEEMRRTHQKGVRIADIQHEGQHQWCAAFCAYGSEPAPEDYSVADDLPLAICHAAARAQNITI